METVAKPRELLALHGVTEELFDTLKRWFDVPDSVPLDLRSVDAVVRELSDPVMIAALAMRKLQALHVLATPGVRTSTDVVVTIVQDLARALLQAPVMRLERAAAGADWDSELAALATHLAPDPTGEGASLPPAPESPDAPDAEAERFAQLHGALHRAVRAVIEASQGEIAYLE